MATWKKIVTESSSNTIAQATTGNAATATALASGRTIGMTGDVVWTSASFDGSGNVTGSSTIQAAQTNITSLLAADIKIGEDDETKIDFETANEIHFYANNTEQVYLADNIFGPQSDSDVDLGTTGVRWKDAYIDTITTTGDLTVGGDVRVNGNDIKASDGTTAITLSGADVTVAGDLTVSGDTTTLNTATLEVEDATVVLAKVGSPTTTTGNGAGINIYTSATGADTAELAWIKDQGAGNLMVLVLQQV